MTGNRAAVLHAPGDIRVEAVPMPTPGEREVLVEIRAVGVCGSDIHYFEHGRIGPHVVQAPLVLGHESAGVVVALGPGATRHEPGDRVALEPGIPCGRCRECRAGRYNLCPHVQFFGTPPVHGAFARYVAIHEDFAFALPDSLSDAAGALMEPLSVGLWACWKGRVSADTDVLVTGAGPIGQLAMQVAFALGAPRVTVTDVNPRRLHAAAERGAVTIDVSRAAIDVDVDVLLECSGDPKALSDGIQTLRPAGRAVCVGMSPSEEVTITLSAIQNRELWLTGTFRYANTYPAAIALAASGRVEVEAIVTGRYQLDDVVSALLANHHNPGSIKPIVEPG